MDLAKLGMSSLEKNCSSLSQLILSLRIDPILGGLFFLVTNSRLKSSSFVIISLLIFSAFSHMLLSRTSVLFIFYSKYTTVSRPPLRKSQGDVKQTNFLSGSYGEFDPYIMAQIVFNTRQMQDENERLTGKPKHIVLPETDDHYADIPSYGKCLHCWGECCGCLRTWLPCLCCCFVEYPYKIVPQSYNGIYQKFGRYVRTVKPGLHYINPCTQTLGMISTKIHVLDLARQNIITKDNVSINIDAAVYYRVINPRFAYYRVQNFSAAIAEITYAILKNTCGQFILQDMLEKRQEIADDIEKQVDQYVEEWGVDIEEIFIKDIQLSRDLQDSLSSAAKERRLAESKIISAKADVEAAKLMRLAAEELNSKAAMQIRYLQTLKQVGRSNTKVIFVPDMKNKDRINHLITQGLLN